MGINDIIMSLTFVKRKKALKSFVDSALQHFSLWGNSYFLFLDAYTNTLDIC